MKTFHSKWSSIVEILRLIRKYEPSYIAWSLPLVFINSVLPLLYVYAPKLIIEKLTNLDPYTEVLRVVLIYSLILILLNVFKTLANRKSTHAAEKFTKKLKYQIGTFIMTLELCEVERATDRDSFNLAKNASELTETMSIIQKTVSYIITIAGLTYITALLEWVYLAVVAAVVGLKALLTFLQFSYNKKVRLMSAKSDRIGSYLHSLSYFNPGAAKELRVNNLQAWFLGKVRKYRYDMVSTQYRYFRYSALFDIIAAFAITLQSFLVLSMLSTAYFDGDISIADFTMHFSAVAALISALSGLADNISKYNQQVLNILDYKKLTGIPCKNIDIAGESFTGDISEINEIKFEHVSFLYPLSNTFVLQDINIRIQAHEKLAIVGLNGSGKSTFIKLLCKFYKPSKGRITINGIDIWTIPNNRYYELIAAVFQDYVNFAFTVSENIMLSHKEDNSKIRELLKRLGMNDFSENTGIYITKYFSPEGVELSGGEAQKLSIARAVYKNAQLLILDEPTASLDVDSESEIYESFYRLSQDRMTVFISHRLALACIANNIAVFESGRIVEYGPHLKLLKQNGLYSEMYRKQSLPYNESLV